MKKHINIIILWGALWGIEEATVGQLLHITALTIGWVLWFPLAWFFMSQVWHRTKSPAAIMITAFISAAIKLVNLLTPIPAQYVICPALSIILEGLAVGAAVKFLSKSNFLRWNHFGGIILTNLSWRLAYLLAVLLIPASIISVYPYVGISALAKFTFYEGLINSVLIYAINFVSGFASRKFTMFSGHLNNLKRVFPFGKPAVVRTLPLFTLALAFAVQFAI